MKRFIRMELQKGLHSSTFYLSIIIGVLITTINVVENISTTSQITENIKQQFTGISSSYIGASLFVNWIAVNIPSLGHQMYYLIWPILAALPYGWSYYQERHNGVYYQMVCRSSKTQYLVAKYLAVFISGGLAVSIPVLINLLISALICPYCIPKVITSIVAIFDGSFLSEIFYSSPWLHALIWCVVEFLWGGVAACCCLISGTKPRLQVIVTLTPFALFVLLDGVISVIRSFVTINIEFSPLQLASAATLYQNPEWVVFWVLGLLLLISFVFGYKRVVKDELI